MRMESDQMGLLTEALVAYPNFVVNAHGLFDRAFKDSSVSGSSIHSNITYSSLPIAYATLVIRHLERMGMGSYWESQYPEELTPLEALLSQVSRELDPTQDQQRAAKENIDTYLATLKKHNE